MKNSDYVKYRPRHGCMVFEDFEKVCFELSHPSLKIAIWLASRTDREDGSIALGVKRAGDMVRDTGVSRTNLYRYLRELVDSGILIKDDTKEYRINPKYLLRVYLK